jgi:hypothetical protein
MTVNLLCSRMEGKPFRIRKPSFYPLNYGNNDICNFRFSTADCKQRTSVVCAEIASVSSYTGNYPAIQRLIPRQDAICREVFAGAIATAFTQFARQIRRFDQRIQASSSRGYIAERIQRTRISYDFGNATDAESDDRFSIEHRLKNYGRRLF